MNSLLTALKLKDVQIEIRSEWQAAGDHSRQTLRQAALAAIEQMSPGWQRPSNLSQIFSNLQQPPQAPGLTCSLAHCPLAGGFVFAIEQNYQLGLDLEVIANVRAEVVARISQPHEVETAPSPALLWVAKEATFKSLLGPHQPQFLSAVQIVSWQQLGSNIWRFRAEIQQLGPFELEGVVQEQDRLVVGLARFSS